MTENHIEKLDELIYKYTGPQKIILEKNITNLTLPGEHHCSLMLKIDVKLKNLNNGNEEVLSVVAKCVNRSLNNLLGPMAPLQFKKEIYFYTTIVPALQKFQHEQGVDNVLDVFPKLIGGRRNLNGNSGEIDEHAVILLENLKVQGYKNIDGQIGYDLEGAKFVLKDLAALHAVPLALKLKKPELFKSMLEVIQVINEDYTKLPKFDYEVPVWLTIASEMEDCKPYVDKARKAWIDYFKDTDWYLKKPCHEPLATLVHYDFWANNIMLKFENDEMIKSKFVDFQMYQYANPMLDVCFFIWSSIHKEIVTEYFEDIVVHYQTHFFKVLEELGCDVTLLKRNFMDDVERHCQCEFIHVLFMVFTIFGRKDDSVVDTDAGANDIIKGSSVTEKAKEHLAFLFREFGKRDWIQIVPKNNYK